jgi:hypothetical protein
MRPQTAALQSIEEQCGPRLELRPGFRGMPDQNVERAVGADVAGVPSTPLGLLDYHTGRGYGVPSRNWALITDRSNSLPVE